MEALLLIGIVLIGILVVASILSFANHSKINTVKTELSKVSETVVQQRTQIVRLIDMVEGLKKQLATYQAKSPAPPANDTQTKLGDQHQDSKAAIALPEIIKTPNEEPENTDQVDAEFSSPISSASSKPIESMPSSSSTVKRKEKTRFSLEKFLMGNGLLWLGAIVLAFGGVFLAKYSIEAGLFPPSLRLIIGASFGLMLVVLGEYLYRNPKRFRINSSTISAALASGGVITCFAMALVAFDFYAFLSPMLAFIVLALIATTATWLSLRYGPILALVGVVGAYIVPALVSTGSNNIFALLVYVSFVSISSLWVHALVKQTRLWWLSLLGHFGWLFISIGIGAIDYQWVIFSYCILSIYLFVLAPILGVKLNQTRHQALGLKALLMPRKEQLGIALPVLALILLYLGQSYHINMVIMLALLSVLLLVSPFRHSAFDSWPFISLGLCVLVFLKIPAVYDYTDNLFPFTQAYLLAQVSAFGFTAYCLFALYHLKQRPSYLLLLVTAPILMMGLAYALSAHQAESYLYPVWSLELMLLAALFAFLSTKTTTALVKMTHLMLANGALTLTFTMLLSAATLSLAIVAQITLMAFLSQKYRISLPDWLYKTAVGLVLLRLTAAPWLAHYMHEKIFGLHWSIVIYPLVLVLFWLANKFQNNAALKLWFEGAMLHVIALFITTETSFIMTGRYPNLFDLDYQQAILLSMNWLILCAVYLWRRQFSDRPRLYVIYSILLGCGVVFTHTKLSVFQNPFIDSQQTGQGLFINWLIPLWAVPAIIIATMLFYRLVSQKLRKPLWILLGFFTAFYINGIIRGAYHPTLSLIEYDIGQQELYVYSIVWLLIAIAVIVFAQGRNIAKLLNVGFSILAIVVLKAFLVDLSSLEGLYRAISFIGLGLSLVGIGWLFQRFKSKSDVSEEQAIP